VRRRVFISASVLSVLLSLATVVVWVRSHFSPIAVDVRTTRWRVKDGWAEGGLADRIFGCVDGTVYLFVYDGPMSKEGTSLGSEYWLDSPEGTHLIWDRSGSSELFEASKADFVRRSWDGFCFDRRRHQLEVTAPAWSLAILCAVLAGIPLPSLKCRPPQGCRHCSYDLTGNVSGSTGHDAGRSE